VTAIEMTSPAHDGRVMMTEDEARQVHDRIQRRDKAQRDDLQTMHDLEGWKVLGYGSWDDYLREAFDYSKSYLSRLNANVKINHQLGTGDDPLPERQTRELKKLPEGLRSEAYETAKSLAQAEDSELQVRHMEMASQQVETKQAVRDSKHRVISVMMDGGDVSPKVALVMCETLDRLDVETYAKVIQIIGQHGLSDAELILPFADMVNRESRTLARILKTGHINDKPIGQASFEDLKQEKRFSQTEIIGEKVEAQRKKASEQGKPVVIAHVVTVYENNPQKTLKAIQKALSKQDMIELRGLLDYWLLKEVYS